LFRVFNCAFSVILSEAKNLFVVTMACCAWRCDFMRIIDASTPAGGAFFFTRKKEPKMRIRENRCFSLITLSFNCNLATLEMFPLSACQPKDRFLLYAPIQLAPRIKRYRITPIPAAEPEDDAPPPAGTKSKRKRFLRETQFLLSRILVLLAEQKNAPPAGVLARIIRKTKTAKHSAPITKKKILRFAQNDRNRRCAEGQGHGTPRTAFPSTTHKHCYITGGIAPPLCSS